MGAWNVEEKEPEIEVIDEENCYKFVITKKTEPHTLNIKVTWIGLAAIVVSAIIVLRIINKPPQSEENLLINDLEAYGFVFSDSNERMLTDEDLISLYNNQTKEYSAERLLRLAINEIYARNNYLFKKEEYLFFYKKYDWYKGELTMVEAYSKFNITEQKNIDFLSNAEKNSFFEYIAEESTMEKEMCEYVGN